MAFAFVACLCSELVWAETIGEYSFTVPKGWGAEKREYGVLIWAADPGRVCHAVLLPSTARTSTPQGEFDKAWRAYAIPDRVLGPPAITQAVKSGWAAVTGTSKMARQSGTMLIITRTSLYRTYSVKGYMGDESCPVEVARLMDSVELIRMSDVKDGWKATVETEFVQVTKGETEVRLLFPDEKLEVNRPNSAEPTEYYWKPKVAPYFKTWQVRQSTALDDPPIYYREAKAQERSTGRSCFIAMKLVFSGGLTWPVLVVAPSESAFRQQFPQPKDLDRMVDHNRFALTGKVLEWEWHGKTEEWGRSTETWITFSGDGTYKGRLVTTSEDLKKSSDDAVRGTYTLSGSEITAANWAAGKSKRFRAKLSVLKHGPQLTLMDLDDPASEYVLSRYW